MEERQLEKVPIRELCNEPGRDKGTLWALVRSRRLPKDDVRRCAVILGALGMKENESWRVNGNSIELSHVPPNGSVAPLQGIKPFLEPGDDWIDLAFLKDMSIEDFARSHCFSNEIEPNDPRFRWA